MEQKITAPRNIIKRIKWKSVLTFIVVVIAVFLVVIGFNPFLSYKGSGDVKIKSWADPNKVSLTGTSTIWVEVRNQGKENKNVSISLKSYNPIIRFIDTTNQEKIETINLGKGESQKLDFKVQISAENEGSYGVRVYANSGNEIIEDDVYINVGN